MPDFVFNPKEQCGWWIDICAYESFEDARPVIVSHMEHIIPKQYRRNVKIIHHSAGEYPECAGWKYTPPKSHPAEGVMPQEGVVTCLEDPTPYSRIAGMPYATMEGVRKQMAKEVGVS